MGLVVYLNPFREALGISRPTHFTDVETEGQSGETHGQVPAARSSDSPVACSFQSTFGQKQLYGAQPLEKLTEQDLGRIHMGQMCGTGPSPARCASQSGLAQARRRQEQARGQAAVLWSSGLRSDPQDRLLDLLKTGRPPGQMEFPLPPLHRWQH